MQNRAIQVKGLQKSHNLFLSVSNLTKSYNTGIITHVLKGVGLELALILVGESSAFAHARVKIR